MSGVISDTRQVSRRIVPVETYLDAALALVDRHGSWSTPFVCQSTVRGGLLLCVNQTQKATPIRATVRGGLKSSRFCVNQDSFRVLIHGSWRTPFVC